MHTQKFHSTKFPKKKTWKTTPHGQLQWWNDAWRRSLARQNETAEATSQPGGQESCFQLCRLFLFVWFLCFLVSFYCFQKKQDVHFFRFCSYIKQHFHYEILGYGFYRYVLKGNFSGSTMFFLQKRGCSCREHDGVFSWCNPLNISIMVVHCPWGETWWNSLSKDISYESVTLDGKGVTS